MKTFLKTGVYIYIYILCRQQVDRLKTSSAIKVLDGKTRAVTT